MWPCCTGSCARYTCVWGCHRKDTNEPTRRVGTAEIDGSRNFQVQSDVAQCPIQNSEGPNQKNSRYTAPDEQTAMQTTTTAPGQMANGNLTKKACVNRNHSCCIRKNLVFFTASSCRLMFTLPYPAPRLAWYRHALGRNDQAPQVKTVAVTQHPWLPWAEGASVHKFCCSTGSGSMSCRLDFGQRCRSWTMTGINFCFSSRTKKWPVEQSLPHNNRRREGGREDIATCICTLILSLILITQLVL